MTAKIGAVERRLAERTAQGALAFDPAQQKAAQHLDALAERLAAAPKGLFGLFSPKPAPRGLYLWGGVGRGKSMLMDLFFETVPIRRKRRVHFHAFMAERHAIMKQLRERPRGRLDQDDLIAAAAEDVVEAAHLLCFDEMQVSDIGDAMILGRLFEQLFDHRVSIVATSNRAPADLYKNGVNRQLFLPFIRMIEAQMTVHELAAARDYRLERLLAAPVYFTPLDAQARAAMDEAWTRLTFGAAFRPQRLEILGRSVNIARACAGCARFSFAELCESPLGPSDYLALADRFHTVFLDDIPLLSPSKTESQAARRLVTLIDALYENGAKLVASAAAEPGALYPDGVGAFEFERTASRLMEMRSRDYLARRHISGADSAGLVET